MKNKITDVPDDGAHTPVEQPKKKYRYVCHGCTNNAGWFQTPAMNSIVICPRCGMEQLTKLENFIYEE